MVIDCVYFVVVNFEEDFSYQYQDFYNGVYKQFYWRFIVYFEGFCYSKVKVDEVVGEENDLDDVDDVFLVIVDEGIYNGLDVQYGFGVVVYYFFFFGQICYRADVFDGFCGCFVSFF